MTQLSSVLWPGEAGRAQREGRRDAMLQELGQRYGYYHQFLVEEQRQLRELPPDATISQFAEHSARQQNLVWAELTLRQALARARGEIRGEGFATSSPHSGLLDGRRPLVDANGLLVDASEPLVG